MKTHALFGDFISIHPAMDAKDGEPTIELTDDESRVVTDYGVGERSLVKSDKKTFVTSDNKDYDKQLADYQKQEAGSAYRQRKNKEQAELSTSEVVTIGDAFKNAKPDEPGNKGNNSQGKK